MSAFDEDALIAGVELVHRSGASSCEIGHTGDEDAEWDELDEPVTWWAKAQYRGAVLTSESYHDPIAAVEALARRVLKGAQCVGCKRTIALSGVGDRKLCRWTREGKHWMPACAPGRARLGDRLAAQGGGS